MPGALAPGWLTDNGRRIATVLVLICFCSASSGCLRAYRPDIQQGNIVTAQMLESLSPGMSRREVRYTLGSPMIEDPFHADRWDYVYTLREGRSNKRQQSLITVVFENDRLLSVEGDENLREIAEKEDGFVSASTSRAKNFWNRVFKRRSQGTAN